MYLLIYNNVLCILFQLEQLPSLADGRRLVSTNRGGHV